jgi:NADH dehydrogenase FAD-containing subunit
MAETRKIVVLGASCAGLGVAHYIAKHVLPQLKSKAKSVKYELHIVDPSTHFWWNIAAPRQIVTTKDLTIEKTFVPIKDGFKQYTSLQDSIFFHQGAASALDTEARTVTITNGETEQGQALKYYALVIATGTKSPTPLTTFHGDYTISQKALEDINVKLASAKDIVISGGGPVGVETAGEIGHALGNKAKVTLITADDKLLPVFNQTRSKKAETLLAKAGVAVIYKLKVEKDQPSSSDPSKTELTLSNGKTITTDVYIPAYGVTPNSQFLPAKLKSAKGYAKTNAATLRVDEAGPRVYAAGDIAGVDTGGLLNMYNSIVVLNRNIAKDLLEKSEAPDQKYSFTEAETQFVPVSLVVILIDFVHLY